jgi:hypothetical protein
MCYEFHKLVLLLINRSFVDHEFLEGATHLFGWSLAALILIPRLIVEVWVVLPNAQECLQLVRLLDGGDHHKILEVAL